MSFTHSSPYISILTQLMLVYHFNRLQQFNGYTPLTNNQAVRGEGEGKVLLPSTTVTAGEKISDVLSHTKDINPPYTQGKTPKVGDIMGSDNG